MEKIFWELPVPSGSFLKSEKFEILPKRVCSLELSYEESDDTVSSTLILFEDVEAFKCTYFRSCSVELIRLAYEKIVDLNNTNWLKEIRDNLEKSKIEATSLKHYAIYFDDGPLYEFICKSITINKKIKS